MKELRETITGGRCPNNTLLAYSRPLTGATAQAQLSTGAQGQEGTQVKGSPISSWTKGLTDQGWDTLWDAREKQFWISQDLIMGCLGEEPKVEKGRVLGDLGRDMSGKIEGLANKKGQLHRHNWLVRMPVWLCPVPAQHSLTCVLI